MPHAPSNDRPAAGRGRRRDSKRICATLSGRTYQALQSRSSQEGRSISNMASYLLERTLLDEALSSH